MMRALTTPLLIAALTAPASAADPFDALTHPVKATLIADTDAIVPGKPFRIGVQFTIEPHWHTYWAHPGDAGAPTRIKVEAPGVTFAAIQWPVCRLINLDGYTSLGYEDSVLHIVPATGGDELKPGQEVTIRAGVQWQVCKAEVCLDGKADLTLKLPVRSAAKPAHEALFAKWQAKIPLTLDDPAAKQLIVAVDQPVAADGSPHSGFTIRWRADAPPPDVRWLPVATRAVAVEEIGITHRGNVTQVQYSTEVFDADSIPGGIVDGVLVFNVSPDHRVGVNLPVRVLSPGPAAER